MFLALDIFIDNTIFVMGAINGRKLSGAHCFRWNEEDRNKTANGGLYSR